jgi:hypothetical protein
MGQLTRLTTPDTVRAEVNPRITKLADPHQLVVLDLPDNATALDVARQLAEHTGKSVIVRDAEMIEIDTVPAPTKHWRLLRQKRSCSRTSELAPQQRCSCVELERDLRGAPLPDAYGSLMSSIIPFVRKSGVVFDDRVTDLLGQAFDAARRELHDRGQPDIVYEIVAVRIIEAARKGERDVSRLTAAGLAALGIQSNAGGQDRFQ